MSTIEHCAYCFDSLLESLTNSIPPPAINLSSSSVVSFPLFVTWKKKSRSTLDHLSDWSLRGCIGTFTSKELSHGLKEFSLISALQDSRFSPIKSNEICLLKVEVSLLINFEQGEHYLDWSLGDHGIQIEFVHL